MSMRPVVTVLTGTAAATGVLLGTSLLSAVPAHAAQGAGTKADPPLTVAHRGASGYAPENTLAAVDKAHGMGFGWVENDVQRTSDGELVVIHDTTLDRTTDVEKVFPDRAPWKVSDFTLSELKKLDAGSWFGKEFEDTRIPTLEEYLKRLDKNGQRLLLELKAPELYPGIEAQTLQKLAEHGWLDQAHVKNKLIIQSFDASAVRSVHALRPAVSTGFLGSPPVSELKTYAKFSDHINPPHAKATEKYVQAVHDLEGPHDKPVKAYAWTIDEPSTAREAAANGVDGIITNYPDVVREATGG